MRPELQSQLERAEELFNELIHEFGPVSLETKNPTLRAQNLTHEIFIKLRSSLDHSMRAMVEKASDSSKHSKIYFPIFQDETKFNKTIRLLNIPLAPESILVLRNTQPFNGNDWLDFLNHYAISGKHLRLIPQTKTFTDYISVHDKQSGRTIVTQKIIGTVEIFGALVDGKKGVIKTNPNIEFFKGTVIGHTFEDSDKEVIPFCRFCIDKTKALLEELSPYMD